jgi:hypothetical protein
VVVVPRALGGVEDLVVVLLREDRMADQVEEDRRHRGMVHLPDTMVPGERKTRIAVRITAKDHCILAVPLGSWLGPEK